MKTFKLLILIIFLLLPVFLFPITSIITLDKSIPLGEMMIENDIFVRFVSDFCIYENSLFLVDKNKGQILITDINRGKLLKKISSFGQGPKELQNPQHIFVQDNKVYVIDTGFLGIKIFSTNGDFIRSFKIRSEYFADPSGKSFAVYNNEIFIPEDNANDQTLVSVYSQDGKRVRGIIRGKPDKSNAIDYLSQRNYHLRIDSSGNVYLLYPLDRKLKKFNPQGDQLWEKEINDKLLNQLSHDDGVRRNERGGLNTSKKVFDIEIDNKDRIFIIHAGGGCIFDQDGNILFLLLNKDPNFPQVSTSMRCIALSKEYLINQAFFSSETIRLFHFKEEIK